MRSLHARRASLLADAATKAFTPEQPVDPGERLAAALRRLPPERRVALLEQLGN